VEGDRQDTAGRVIADFADSQGCVLRNYSRLGYGEGYATERRVVSLP
jgi:hypothetical protein